MNEPQNDSFTETMEELRKKMIPEVEPDLEEDQDVETADGSSTTLQG